MMVLTLVLLVLILIIFVVWYFKKGVVVSLWDVTSGVVTKSSKSSIKAESVLLATEVFPDE